MEPYRENLLEGDPFVKKRQVEGRLAVILDGKLQDRQLHLIQPISRAVKKGEIHELIITDDELAAPGRVVNSIAYLGFFEVEVAGVLVSGDNFRVEGDVIGKIAGFDLTHAPNHLNIILYRKELISGKELGLELEMKITAGQLT
ncbi:MAG: hypothetical protein UMV23_01445 [Halanaerobium sp.]|nr:hypothetical protein [Halanaerobium sp.]